MNKTTQRILTVAAILAIGILTVIFPIFSGAIATAVGVLGVLFAVIMGTLARTVLRTRRMTALAVISFAAAAVGMLLLLNRLWRFADMRILVLAELVPMGILVLTLGLHCKERAVSFWLYVVIAGGGAIVAGISALWRVEAAFLTGCVTASVILLLPVVLKRIAAGKDARGNKIVVVKEKDIEVIDDEPIENRK